MRVVSLSSLLAVVVVLVAIGGSVWLNERDSDRAVELAVLNSDLPAYHQISAADIAEDRIVRSRRDSEGAVASPEDLVGRYLLAQTKAGTALMDSGLGPALEQGALDDRTAVAVEATDAMTLAGTLTGGSLVDVTMVPPDGSSASPVHLPGLIVLNVLKTSSNVEGTAPHLLVLAVPNANLQSFTEAIALGTLVVYPSPTQ